MSLSKDFQLHTSTHLDALKSLRGGLPSGLPAQLAEVAAVLADYDVAESRIRNDKTLSAEGKSAQYKTARDAALAAIAKWSTSRTTGIDAQAAALRVDLQAAADQALPAPNDMQVQMMIQRLSAFDPLEVEILYADATDAERRVIEVAAEALGRQPRKMATPSGDQFVWQPLLAPERIAAAREARLQAANPETAAELNGLQAIRGVYEALAGTAATLVRDSLPAFAVPVA